MGFPRKGSIRLYFEENDGTYLLVFHELSYNGTFEAVGELLTDNDPERPCLCSASVDRRYLGSWRSGKDTGVSRTSWSQMPKVWQDALAEWLDGPPEEHRGLWFMHELPRREKQDTIPAIF